MPPVAGNMKLPDRWQHQAVVTAHSGASISGALSQVPVQLYKRANATSSCMSWLSAARIEAAVPGNCRLPGSPDGSSYSMHYFETVFRPGVAFLVFVGTFR